MIYLLTKFHFACFSRRGRAEYESEPVISVQGGICTGMKTMQASMLHRAKFTGVGTCFCSNNRPCRKLTKYGTARRPSK